MYIVLYNVALTSLSLTVEGVTSGFTLHQAKCSYIRANDPFLSKWLHLNVEIRANLAY